MSQANGDDDNVALKNGGGELILTLTNVTQQNAGIYTCVAVQEHKTLKNQISKKVEVKVECEFDKITNITVNLYLLNPPQQL